MRLITSLLFLGFSSTALAQERPELSWPELLERPLIVRATVTDGGLWVATVRVDQVARGEAPDGLLTVTGFNSPGFPAQAVENETFREGQQYWLFLEPFDGPNNAGEIPIDLSTLPDVVWRVPGPVVGDLPILVDGVKLRSLRPAYPVFGTVVPSDRFERFLRLGLALADGEQPASEELKPFYDCLSGAEVLSMEDPRMESSQAQCAAFLAHLGATVWSEDLLRLAASSSDVSRAAAGMAAAGMRGQAALDVTVRAVLDPSPMTHAFAMQAMASGDRKREVSGVISQILVASRTDELQRSVPLENVRSDEGRIKIARALVGLGERSSASVLVNEIRYCNPEVLAAYVEAIELLGSREFEAPLVELLRLQDGRFMVVLESLKRFEVTSARGVLHELLADATLDEERVRKVLWALESLGNAETVDLVRARLIQRIEVTTQWSDTERDLGSAELAVLGQLQGARALDLAFELARSYLGLPRQVANPAWRETYEAELERVHTAASGSLGQGSSVGILWIAARPEELGTGDAGVSLYLDVHADPMMSGVRAKVAQAVSADPQRVRVCGPGVGGWRCEEGEHAPWRRHQTMVNAIVDVMLMSAGYGDGADLIPVDEAVAWLHVLDESGVAAQVGSDWKLRDVDRSIVPVHLLPVAPPLFSPEHWQGK
ncbi:MAG: hypothetical protein ACI9MC_002035 [Kiritimatiellia bacterium]|jgi:hypothetical protein